MNKKELELYIHIPFCVRKCSYCDFLLPLPRSRQGKPIWLHFLQRSGEEQKITVTVP